VSLGVVRAPALHDPDDTFVLNNTRLPLQLLAAVPQSSGSVSQRVLRDG
jgi:hypothetical protein